MSTSILDSAFKAFEEKDLQKAHNLVEQAYGKNPRDLETLYLRGLIHLDMQSPAQAIDDFKQALLGQMPQDTRGTIYYHKAVAHKRLGELKAANQDIETVLRLKPHFKQARMMQAQLLDDPLNAIKIYEDLLQKDPEDGWIYFELSSLYAKLEKHQSALENLEKAHKLLGNDPLIQSALASAALAFEHHDMAYEHALQLHSQDPENKDNLYLLAKSELKTNRPQNALTRYEKLHKMDPDLPGPLVGLAETYAALKENDQAIEYFEKAIQDHPESIVALNNYGNFLRLDDRFEEAHALYTRALKLEPENVDVLINLAYIHKSYRRFDEAHALLEQAIKIKPKYFKIYENLLVLFLELGRFEENNVIFNTHKDALIQNHRACLNYGFNNLAMGRFEEGWHYHEHRKFLSRDYGSKSHYPQSAKDWEGEDLTGKIIFLSTEQGLGDEIMFASCFKDVVDAAKLTIIECDHRMRGILARSFPKAMFFPRQGRYNDELKDTVKDYSWLKHLPAIDYICPIGSLPKYTRPTLESYYQQTSFFKPKESLAAQMKARLNALPHKIKVGICWRSGLLSTERKKYYVSLDDFAPLFKHKNVDFIVLQYDECKAEIAEAREKYGVTLHHFDDLDLKKDLEASIALNASLDLIITAPTSVGELGGAVGTPTWRLEGIIPWTCLGTENRPFYPSMTCFRSTKEEPWGDMFKDINAKFKVFLKEKLT